jgi:hypothetical protein
MSLALGGYAFGTEPLAGDPLHDPPTVVVTAPTGTVSTGGPVLTVEWDYAQPQGDAQEWYRVLAQNDAGTTTFYDSGWLPGTDASLGVDVDAEEIPHDSSDLTWMVQVRGPEGIGTGTVARYQVEDDEAIVIDWGDPAAAITAPGDGGVVDELTGLDVSWTFTDAGKTQSAYRVRLLLHDSSLVEHDTGWVASAATSYEVPITLRDGSVYDVEVQLKNNHGIRSD